MCNDNWRKCSKGTGQSSLRACKDATGVRYKGNFVFTWTVFFWWGSGHATPKYSTLAYGIFETEGNWEWHMEEGLYELPLKQIMWEVASLYPEERNLLISTWGMLRAIWADLAVSPVSYAQLMSFCPLPFSLNSPLFIQSSIKTLRCDCLFRFSFPYEGSHIT